ncbi:MAG: penicillin-binding protein 2 [Oscillospiraceae bacterium]|nr:penicillin-binding protein 2 [Oscillospiraceae bacterium]
MGKRIVSFFIVESIILTALYLRVWNIMGEDGLIGAGEEQNTYTLSAYSMRANIYDRNFEKLVNEEEAFASAILPSQTDERFFEYFPKEKARELSALIAEGKPFLYTTDTNPTGAAGVEVFKYYKRYSENQLASNIIGYTDSTFKGMSGLEKCFDNYFIENGGGLKISYSVNAMGSFLEGTASEIYTSGSVGAGLVLTIDKEIQRIVEKEGEKIKKGAVVVMEPYSGEILAAASFPKLDINNLSAALEDPNSPFINRAFSAYSIGSTFKIAMCAAALENGISAEESFLCEGEKELSGTVFRCHKSEGHGLLCMKEAIEQSCNPYFIELGQRLGFLKIVTMAEKLGFGEATDFGEGFTTSAGTLPTEADIKTVGDLANLSFGQGSLLATPVQLAAAVSAVVNSGRRPTPQLIKGYTGDDGTQLLNATEGGSYTTAFSAETAAKIKGFMISAVENGTGSPALPEKGSAGGKTGSAETGQFDKWGNQILNALFCGFYPAASPKYSIVVLCEDGVSGSTTCGPIFRNICNELANMES